MASQRLPPSLPSRTMSGRYFYGWNVVAATFVMALFSFGLGFYGLRVYVATLQRIHGWSASAVSAPVTVYYVAGALLTMVIGAAFERFGPRVVVCVGSVAMAAGAAVNIIPAPWFERRRGLAVSVAFNGATLGGVTLTPALYPGGRRLSGGQFLGRGAEFREGAFRQQGLCPAYAPPTRRKPPTPSSPKSSKQQTKE